MVTSSTARTTEIRPSASARHEDDTHEPEQICARWDCSNPLPSPPGRGGRQYCSKSCAKCEARERNNVDSFLRRMRKQALDVDVALPDPELPYVDTTPLPTPLALRWNLATRGPLPEVRADVFRYYHAVRQSPLVIPTDWDRLIEASELVRNCGRPLEQVDQLHARSRQILLHWHRRKNYPRLAKNLLDDATTLRALKKLKDAKDRVELAHTLLRTRCAQSAYTLKLRHQAAVLAYRLSVANGAPDRRFRDEFWNLAEKIDHPVVWRETWREDAAFWSVQQRDVDRARSSLALVSDPNCDEGDPRRFASIEPFTRTAFLRAAMETFADAADRRSAAALAEAYADLVRPLGSAFHGQVAARWGQKARGTLVVPGIYYPIAGELL